jgi:D-amino acid aminotransferase
MKASGVVFLNGRFVSAARATVSIYDRGLMYGDGLFETMRAYRGTVFALDDHLQRLHGSARQISLPVPGHEWRSVFNETLKRNRMLERDAIIRLMVTRGEAPPGLAPPAVARPTCIVMTMPLDAEIERLQRTGVPIVILPFARETFAELKSLNYLPGVIGKLLAQQRNAYEGIFTTEGGVLLEGTTTSLFGVQNGALFTAPEQGILPGVTRRIVIELALATGLRVVERGLRFTELRRSDEVFLTSSVVEVLPVTRVDGTRIATGGRGPITRKLQRLYRDAVHTSCRIH